MTGLRFLCLGNSEVVPPSDGGREGIHGAIAALAKKAEVTYAYPCAGDAAAARAGFSAINVRPVPVAFSPQESVATIAASTLRLLPYKFAKQATSHAVDSFAAALESRPFDAVICFQPHMVRLAEGILERRGARLPIIVREHNIEYALIEDYAKRLAFPLGLPAMAYAWITRREEQRIWRRVDAVAMLSDADMAAVRATGVRANFLLAPEGVPLPSLRSACWPGSTAPLLVLFNPGWPQNIINLRIFYERYWTEVQAAGALPGIALAITGVGKSELARLLRVSAAQLDAQNVRALGFVDRLAEVFASSLALVSATFSGGGIRKKVLEAMAHQLPVIATPMDVATCSFYRPGENLLCMESVAGFTAAVQRLAGQPAFWLSLSQAARTTVERHANWERFAEAIMKEAVRLVGAAHDRPIPQHRFQTAKER